MDSDIKVILTAVQRVNVLQLLPERGPIQTVRLLQTLQGKLGYSEKEQEVFDAHKRVVPGNEGPEVLVDWLEVEKKVKPKTIRFNGFEHKLVVERLEALDKAEALRAFHLPLWMKFCEKGSGSS